MGTVYDLLQSGVSFDRVTFEPAMSVAHDDGDFWDEWEQYRDTFNASEQPCEVVISNPLALLPVLSTDPAAQKARCWYGNIAFHIKADGRYFPCSIIGGEVGPTQDGFELGNINNTALHALWKSHTPHTRYRECECHCERICRLSNYQLNAAAERASRMKFEDF
jgi:hypothetical protein